ncbi:uncharacterized protein MKK02DRAFT_27765 [Dioszegia hungarica]|uniref:Uncharacterized protein n=1 Tax=Dioszegia hungarica TaxID=4972 RepID=A0AA38H5N1_9TREE|nr:uncharacterized protein MKK02DRAFT_27765 [Dioszegia hungarica]KAI9634565.1 hypothetical protein MKK02DRAFT_27765 [Dioszegia hungarica]
MPTSGTVRRARVHKRDWNGFDGVQVTVSSSLQEGASVFSDVKGEFLGVIGIWLVISSSSLHNGGDLASGSFGERDMREAMWPKVKLAPAVPYRRPARRHRLSSTYTLLLSSFLVVQARLYFALHTRHQHRRTLPALSPPRLLHLALLTVYLRAVAVTSPQRWSREIGLGGCLAGSTSLCPMALALPLGQGGVSWSGDFSRDMTGENQIGFGAYGSTGPLSESDPPPVGGLPQLSPMPYQHSCPAPRYTQAELHLRSQRQNDTYRLIVPRLALVCPQDRQEVEVQAQRAGTARTLSIVQIISA